MLLKIVQQIAACHLCDTELRYQKLSTGRPAVKISLPTAAAVWAVVLEDFDAKSSSLYIIARWPDYL